MHGAIDDRDASRAEVRRFLLDVIDLAGGPRAVAEQFGVPEGTVRTWRTTKTPEPAMLFALAKRYGVSLDQYALTASLRDEIASLRQRVAALEAGAA